MLPENVDTERGRYLQNIIKHTRRSEWADWPTLTRSDFVLVGQIVVLFSYMDLNLRRIAEVADHAGVLRLPWRGKTARLTMDHTEDPPAGAGAIHIGLRRGGCNAVESRWAANPMRSARTTW
jgi:hypothetical protein